MNDNNEEEEEEMEVDTQKREEEEEEAQQDPPRLSPRIQHQREISLREAELGTATTVSQAKVRKNIPTRHHQKMVSTQQQRKQQQRQQRKFTLDPSMACGTNANGKQNPRPHPTDLSSPTYRPEIPPQKRKREDIEKELRDFDNNQEAKPQINSYYDRLRDHQVQMKRRIIDETNRRNCPTRSYQVTRVNYGVPQRMNLQTSRYNQFCQRAQEQKPIESKEELDQVLEDTNTFEDAQDWFVNH